MKKILSLLRIYCFGILGLITLVIFWIMLVNLFSGIMSLVIFYEFNLISFLWALPIIIGCIYLIGVFLDEQ